MTSLQRTQVYLDPADHRRLRRLAAARDQSMTDLVREAVGAYLADEASADYDDLASLQTALESQDQYASSPQGRAGLLARCRVRATSLDRDPVELTATDRAFGDALAAEHERHRDAVRRRLGSDG